MKSRRVIVSALALTVVCAPIGASAQRIAPERVGMKWGRCLLVVEGLTRIDGGCYYQIYAGGNFHIDGPRQVFEDENPSEFPMGVSRDYWFNVFRDGGGWSGYGNSNVRSTHGEGPTWENLQRDGACLINRHVRVCLWRE